MRRNGKEKEAMFCYKASQKFGAVRLLGVAASGDNGSRFISFYCNRCCVYRN